MHPWPKEEITLSISDILHRLLVNHCKVTPSNDARENSEDLEIFFLPVNMFENLHTQPQLSNVCVRI
jgi:hypothetical protein